MAESDFFGGRLRELRLAAGLSQPELAQRAGLSKQLVHAYEAGQYLPSWDRAVALAAALGVEVCAFREQPHQEQ